MTLAPPSISFEAVVTTTGSMAAIPIGFDPRRVFGRARAPVIVEIGGHAYRTTIATRDGATFVPLRRAHRDAAELADTGVCHVTLTLDTQPRVVTPPPDLAAAIDAAGLRDGWAALSYTRRREHAEAVASARRPDTRTRRIATALAAAAAAAAAGASA